MVVQAFASPTVDEHYCCVSPHLARVMTASPGYTGSSSAVATLPTQLAPLRGFTLLHPPGARYDTCPLRSPVCS